MIFEKIFVKISSLIEAILHKYHLKATNWSAFLFGFSFLIFSSCSTTRTIPIETIHKDTVYLSNIQYDSIYIYKDHYQDRTKDTVYLKDVSIEYRYKLLKDTVRVVERDSIPYEVRLTEKVEVPRPLSWFDHLTRTCFWLLIGGLCLYLFRVVRSFI